LRVIDSTNLVFIFFIFVHFCSIFFIFHFFFSFLSLCKFAIRGDLLFIFLVFLDRKRLFLTKF